MLRTITTNRKYYITAAPPARDFYALGNLTQGKTQRPLLERQDRIKTKHRSSVLLFLKLVFTGFSKIQTTSFSRHQAHNKL